MKIKDLINEFTLPELTEYAEHEVDNLQRKHEKVTKNTLFFDLFSKSTNREMTVKKIIKSNPYAIVTDRVSDYAACNLPIIPVKNARRAYAEAYSRFCDINYSTLTFIGITETNEKTSTATMLRKILRADGHKTGFIGTGKILSDNEQLTETNYSMTCPDPEVLYPAIKRIEEDGCEIIIMEVSSHALALDKVSPIPFRIAAFTGLSPEHLDFHESMDAYFKDKEKLIKSAELCIVNCDDSWGRKLYESYTKKSIGIGILTPTDNTAIQLSGGGLTGTSYVYKSNNFSTAITLNLPGIYNVYNSMIAFAAAVNLGIKPVEAKRALANIKSIDGRCEIICKDITVIIDYAHTSAALLNLLKTVYSDIKPEQNITLVFGCGGERDREKRPQMAAVAERYCSKTIVTNDNPRGEDELQIINDIIAGFTKKKYGIIRDREKAIRHSILTASRSDVVIICGKGHEKYIYDKNGYRYFDERKIIDEALKDRESKFNAN